MAESDDGFLNRWARRKEAARYRSEAPDAASKTPSAARTGGEPARAEATEAPANQAVDQAELIESLPDIDNMTRESDFSVFMQNGVPRTLRNRALRKLWRLDPVFANLDGLNDYDEDYTAIGKPLSQVVSTLYQVGRGMGGTKPVPDAQQTEPTGELSEEAASAEAASAEATEHSPEAAADEAAHEPAEAAEALPGLPAENQPVMVEPALAEPSVGAGPESASPRAPTPNEAPKGGSATTRRWGRFAT